MKVKNALLSCVLAAACVFGLTGCKEKVPSGNISEEITFKDGDKIAEINIEGYGTIRAKLFSDIAPDGVKNFEMLVEKGYYDGLKIHREGDNAAQFYIVNSKKTDDITKYSPELIRNEANLIGEQMEGLTEGDPLLTKLTYDQTSLNNLADMIANASDEVKTRYAEKGGCPLWDGAYTVFGQVYEGFEVLDKLSSVEVMTGRDGELDKPKTDIIIESVKITVYEEPEPEPESKASSKKK